MKKIYQLAAEITADSKGSSRAYANQVGARLAKMTDLEVKALVKDAEIKVQRDLPVNGLANRYRIALGKNLINRMPITR